jgi:DNA-3-methyladenine glycosylase I
VYHNFNLKRVAKYSEKDFVRLMSDTGIIRNKLKINATIHNAQKILEIQKEYKSFSKWLDIQSKEIKQDKEKWVKLFKKNFKFVGGEIVGEFLMSINMLDGSHDKNCDANGNKKSLC